MTKNLMIIGLGLGVLAAYSPTADAACVNGQPVNMGVCVMIPPSAGVTWTVDCNLSGFGIGTPPYDMHMVVDTSTSTMQLFGVDAAGAGWCDMLNYSGTELVWDVRLHGSSLNDRLDLHYVSASSTYMMGAPGSSQLAMELAGVAGDDVLAGSDGFGLYSELILGGDGDDSISGRDGNDLIYGGADNDEIWGEGGLDWIYGEDGRDEIWGGDEIDGLFGGSGPDTLHGGDGNDLVYGGDGIDFLLGNAGDDQLFGGAGDDTLWGDDVDLYDSLGGDDRLRGDDGNDFLHGEGGDDLLCGGEETGGVGDFLFGGYGNDSLWGPSDDFGTSGLINEGSSGPYFGDSGYAIDVDECDGVSSPGYAGTCDSTISVAPSWCTLPY